MAEKNEHESNGRPDVDLVKHGSQWLEELFGNFDLKIKVEGQQKGDDLSFDIKGPDAHQFVEGLGMSKGQLVSVIQTLLFAVLQRQGWSRGSLSVDAMSFRREREENLGSVAGVLSEKVRALGKAITVLGMDSMDRKAIHRCLDANPNVKSESEGYGAMRRLKVTEL